MNRKRFTDRVGLVSPAIVLGVASIALIADCSPDATAGVPSLVTDPNAPRVDTLSTQHVLESVDLPQLRGESNDEVLENSERIKDILQFIQDTQSYLEFMCQEVRVACFYPENFDVGIDSTQSTKRYMFKNGEGQSVVYDVTTRHTDVIPYSLSLTVVDDNQVVAISDLVAPAVEGITIVYEREIPKDHPNYGKGAKNELLVVENGEIAKIHGATNEPKIIYGPEEERGIPAEALERATQQVRAYLPLLD